MKRKRDEPDFSRSREKREKAKQWQDALDRRSDDDNEDLSDIEVNDNDVYVSDESFEEGDEARRYPRMDRLVNLKHGPGEKDLYFPEDLMKYIKPHQRDGIRFMWRNIQMPEDDDLRGCILAHSMGLGKTFQAFVFCYLFWITQKNLQKSKPRILIITPKVTLANWASEFRMWQSEKAKLPKPIIVHALDTVSKDARLPFIRKWFEDEGGVLLMGYEMYSNIVFGTRSDTEPVLYRKYLCEPGPDLVILDEGHRVKSKKTTVTKALSKIKTRRRVCLTGYPLQNCLMEYWCMVDWIRPDYWDPDDFKREFKEPIEGGQAKEATDSDVMEMKNRLYMLTEALRGFVQRKDQSILEGDLQPKTEYVVTVKLTQIQRKLYKLFVDRVCKEGQTSTLAVTSMLQRICNHPDIVKQYFERKEREGRKDRKKKVLDDDDEDDDDEMDKDLGDRDNSEGANFDWAAPVFDNPDYLKNVVENGGKMSVLFSIIHSSVLKERPEKVLVFSQFTETLDVIELLLKNRQMPGATHLWRKNEDYFRLDGQCSVQRRQDMINMFNARSNKTMLFLISTRAGGIGINLVGASRVVVFDVCWNPCHDNQAIFRAYRYGQTRPVKIYRLVAKGTTEDKIYQRSLLKMWLFSRVVDDKAPVRNLDNDTKSMLFLEEDDHDVIDVRAKDTDPGVLDEVVYNCGDIITNITTKDSLFIEDPGDRLNEAEKRDAESNLQFLKNLKGKDARSKDSAKNDNEKTRMGLEELKKEQQKEMKKEKATLDNISSLMSDIFGGTTGLDDMLSEAKNLALNEIVPTTEQFESRITGKPASRPRSGRKTINAETLKGLEEVGKGIVEDFLGDMDLSYFDSF